MKISFYYHETEHHFLGTEMVISTVYLSYYRHSVPFIKYLFLTISLGIIEKIVFFFRLCYFDSKKHDLAKGFCADTCPLTLE